MLNTLEAKRAEINEHVMELAREQEAFDRRTAPIIAHIRQAQRELLRLEDADQIDLEDYLSEQGC